VRRFAITVLTIVVRVNIMIVLAEVLERHSKKVVSSPQPADRQKKRGHPQLTECETFIRGLCGRNVVQIGKSFKQLPAASLPMTFC
jgi:hypothetical protein